MSAPADPRTPHVERTRYVKQEPPARLTLYFCPACGKQITGTYNLEPARACTKRWHLAEPVGYDYELVEPTP